MWAAYFPLLKLEDVAKISDNKTYNNEVDDRWMFGSGSSNEKPLKLHEAIWVILFSHSVATNKTATQHW